MRGSDFQDRSVSLSRAASAVAVGHRLSLAGLLHSRILSPYENPEFRASLSEESKLGSRGFAPGRGRHDLGGARSEQRLYADRDEIDRVGTSQSSRAERPIDRALVGWITARGALPASAPSACPD